MFQTTAAAPDTLRNRRILGRFVHERVEPHVQTEIRAVVSPVPYVETIRRSYRPDGWRAARV
jgi:hypothetical protein